MTDAQARQCFEAALARAETSEQRDNIRLCMEYFTNPAFRQAMADAVWAARAS